MGTNLLGMECFPTYGTRLVKMVVVMFHLMLMTALSNDMDFLNSF